MILAGHGRVKAARLLGLASIPCVRIDHMSLEQKRAYIIADIASHKTGRKARVIELDPLYVDRTIRRWETFAKDEAIHAETGKSFEELASERTS
jgi:hypothetical protein